MAGAGGVFHVTFGINETELTQALEAQKYDVAARIIRDNSYTSFLDEGCYQRTPLYLCLCGEREDEVTPMPRNLQLACMLAQYGAAVNYRVPKTFYGSEYMGPGKTSLELVVELFNAITMHPCHGVAPYDLDREHIIGHNGGHVNRQPEVLQELLDTAFILLTHGGEPGVVDDRHQSLLHRTAVYSTDPRMLYLLCENADSRNMVDGKGNTVLAALCDGYWMGGGDFLATHGDPYTECCHLEGKADFLDYLLSQPDLDLDHENHQGRTALWLCMVRGDIVSAGKLLAAGCDAAIQGQIRDRGSTRPVSALLAALCGQQNIPPEKCDANAPVQTHFLAHLVDQGYFDSPAIVSELHALLEEAEFREFRSLQCLGSALVPLMFGGTTSTLRQLCTRVLFRRVFLSGGSSVSSSVAEPKYLHGTADSDSESGSDLDSEHSNDDNEDEENEEKEQGGEENLPITSGHTHCEVKLPEDFELYASPKNSHNKIVSTGSDLNSDPSLESNSDPNFDPNAATASSPKSDSNSDLNSTSPLSPPYPQGSISTVPTIPAPTSTVPASTPASAPTVESLVSSTPTPVPAPTPVESLVTSTPTPAPAPTVDSLVTRAELPSNTALYLHLEQFRQRLGTVLRDRCAWYDDDSDASDGDSDMDENDSDLEYW